jgi:Ca2+/Na+ antiporter
MRNILLQNLFTSLPDTVVVFYFYLELQNSKFSKTSWVGSQILYMSFYQKFSIIQYVFSELWMKHEAIRICQILLTQLTSLFYISSCGPPIEENPIGLVQ